jgi:hypothetical protein
VQNKIQTAQTQKGYLLNVQTAKDMGIPEIIAISNQDAPNVQVIT